MKFSEKIDKLSTDVKDWYKWFSIMKSCYLGKYITKVNAYDHSFLYFLSGNIDIVMVSQILQKTIWIQNIILINIDSWAVHRE